MTDAAPIPPAAASNYTLRTVIAWVVILATTLFIAQRILRTSPTSQGAAGLSQMQSDLLARYVIGVKGFVEGTSSNASGTLQTLLGSVKASAGSAEDKLRIAPLIAEISGRDAAIGWLDSIRKDNPGQEQIQNDVRLMDRLYQSGPGSITATQRQQIMQRHGWPARLALSYGQNADNAERKQVMGEARRTVVGVVVMVALVVTGVFVIGPILLVVALVMGINGKLRSQLPAPVGRTPLLLEMFAIYLAGTVLVSTVVRGIMPHIGMGAAWLAVLAVVAAIAWPVINGMSFVELRRLLGWHVGRGVFREIAAGLLGYVAGLPLMAIGIGAAYLLARSAGTTPEHPIVHEIGKGQMRDLMLLLLAAGWAPIVEETMFRGALFYHLRQRLHWLVAAIVVGLLFAILHPQGWTALPVLGTIGFNFAVLRQWRGSLIAPMMAHALNNFGVFVFLIVCLG